MRPLTFGSGTRDSSGRTFDSCARQQPENRTAIKMSDATPTLPQRLRMSIISRVTFHEVLAGNCAHTACQRNLNVPCMPLDFWDCLVFERRQCFQDFCSFGSVQHW